jgi:hypothetical protein
MEGQMKKLSLVAIIGLLAGTNTVIAQTLSQGTQVAGQQLSPSDIGQVRYQQISTQSMCERMSAQLASYGNSIGLARGRSQLYALETTQRLISSFRQGSRDEYIDMRTLPFHRDIAPRPENAYLNLVGILGNSLGIQGRMLLAFDVNDLRFLPQVQVGSEIILVVRSTDGLTSERARSVVAVAKRQQLHISVVWVGPTVGQGTSTAAQEGLGLLAAVTGGTFTDLGGTASPCSNLL